MQIQQQMKETLEQAQKIAIFGHQSIDGDAIGSMFGLGLQLEKLGKQVSYFTPDKESQNFDFLPEIQNMQYEFDYADYDVLIFVDFSGYGRIKKFTENHIEYFDQIPKVIIDHHLFDHAFQNALVYRDESAISCAELIFELSKKWRDLIDKKVATFLYMGILTDSGNFSYDSGEESIRVMNDAIDLLILGADKASIILNIFHRKSLKEVQFSSLILERMQMQDDLIFSRHSQEELELFGVHGDASDTALYTMVTIEGGELVILGKEVKDAIKMSFRGKGRYNCRDLCVAFGGGGHHNAAGCTIPKTGNLEEDIFAFIGEIKEILN